MENNLKTKNLTLGIVAAIFRNDPNEILTLLQAGENPNIYINKKKFPLLFLAIALQDIKTLQILLEDPRTDLNIKDGKNRTAYDIALKTNNLAIISLFERKKK